MFEEEKEIDAAMKSKIGAEGRKFEPVYSHLYFAITSPSMYFCAGLLLREMNYHVRECMTFEHTFPR